MKFFLLVLFSGSLLFSQAQNAIKFTGSWCDSEMKLTVDLGLSSDVMSWFLDEVELEGENSQTIDCHKYGAGLYEVKIAQDYNIISSIFEVSSEGLPEINFTSVNYPAAAVTVFENVTIEGEEIESLIWDFGNGETSTDHRGLAFYKTEKVYTIKLTVQTVSGCTYTVIKNHEWSYN